MSTKKLKGKKQHKPQTNRGRTFKSSMNTYMLLLYLELVGTRKMLILKAGLSVCVSACLLALTSFCLEMRAMNRK